MKARDLTADERWLYAPWYIKALRYAFIIALPFLGSLESFQNTKGTIIKATNHITNTTMAKKNESNFITDPVQAYFMAKLENVIRFHWDYLCMYLDVVGDDDGADRLRDAYEINIKAFEITFDCDYK